MIIFPTHSTPMDSQAYRSALSIGHAELQYPMVAPCLLRAKAIIETLFLIAKIPHPQANPAVTPLPRDSLSIRPSSPGLFTLFLIAMCPCGSAELSSQGREWPEGKVNTQDTHPSVAEGREDTEENPFAGFQLLLVPLIPGAPWLPLSKKPFFCLSFSTSPCVPAHTNLG